MVYGVGLGFYDGNEDFLEHHGIKGQKWGVRRTKAQLSRLGGGKKTKPETKEAKSEEKSANNTSKQAPKQDEPHTQIGRKKAKEMTDKELAAAVKRLETEKKYKDLMSDTRNNKIHVNTKKVINDALEESMKNVVSNALTQVGKYALASAVNKATGRNLLDVKTVTKFADAAKEAKDKEDKK